MFIHIFNNKSMDDILHKGLILCHFDTSDDVFGLNREILDSEITKYNDVAFDYGSKYSERIQIKFALVKKDKSSFTVNEIRRITKWLMTENNQKLKLISDSHGINDGYFYFGKSNSVIKKRVNREVGLVCTFVNDSAYLYKENKVSIGKTTTIYVDSDVDIIYPTIHIKTKSNTVVELFNKSTNEKISFNATPLGAKIDCENLTVTDLSGKTIVDENNHPIFLSKLFNSDQLFLSLKNGRNEIKVLCQAIDTEIFFKYTEKLYGGILDEFGQG